MVMEGIITPSQWDPSGVVTNVHLAQANEMNIPLKLVGKFEELLKHNGARVVIAECRREKVFRSNRLPNNKTFYRRKRNEKRPAHY